MTRHLIESSMERLQVPPFQEKDEIIRSSPTSFAHGLIPNEPTLSSSKASVEDFLHYELDTSVLDELHPHLWLVAKKFGSHIDSLHEHFLKERTVKVTESAALHLIWYYRVVYLKPIPHCLLNHKFWNDYLAPKIADQQQGNQTTFVVDSLSLTCRSALGFLRSYGYLVRHESDFILAQEAHLIPKTVSYASFQVFIDSFRCLSDSIVSPRFHYGQIRLTRLNYAVRIFRPSATGQTLPWYYQEPYWQTGQFFQQFGAPLLFIFASLSLILSAMQVGLASGGPTAGGTFAAVSSGFSVAIIIFNTALALCAAWGVITLLCLQFAFAVRFKRKEKTIPTQNPA